MKYLNCRSNGLKTLNISGCSALTGLICYSNQIAAIDVSACPKNIAVACDKNTSLVNTPTILTDTIPGTTRKASYSFQINGMAGTKWAVSKRARPDGLTLKASTGKVTGTATKAGTFTFTVQLKDSSGKTATKDYTLKVTQTAVTGSIPAMTTRRASYTGTPKASGGASQYAWTISAGSLPDGLKLNASTGKITGTATKAGRFTFTVKAKDANGAAGKKSYTIKVTQTAVSGTLSNAIKGTFYTGTPKASGGTSPYVWSVSAGNLPDGVKINSSTGKITGTPTKTGTFTFTIKAKDSNGAAGSKQYTIKVTASASSAKSSLTDSKAGAKNAAGVSAQGHNSVSALPALPATFSTTLPEADGITIANLPASLRVKSDDIIEAFSGKDSDIVIVKTGMPVTFILDAEISGAAVYVDDKPAKGVEISDDGTFMLPAEFVRDDFKVCVKSSNGITESEELYITAE